MGKTEIQARSYIAKFNFTGADQEKKLEVQEEVELKSPSNESSKDSEKPKTEITNSTGGFRKWLNKKESPLTNFLYIALGFIVIPSGRPKT